MKHLRHKNTTRSKKIKHSEKQLCLLEESIESNWDFWDQWNSVCQSEPEELLIQDRDIWTQHFHTLFGPKPPGTDLQTKQILEKLLNMELIFKDHQNPLDFLVTINHLKTKLKTLKSKKACGPDGRLNQMLKYSTEKFHLSILK